jgi:hypothetical protein
LRSIVVREVWACKNCMQRKPRIVRIALCFIIACLWQLRYD